MTKLRAVLVGAGAVVLALSLVVGLNAQPVPGGGIRYVAHDGSLTGSGTSGSSLAVANSAGANIVPKSNGTSLVASDLSDASSILSHNVQWQHGTTAPSSSQEFLMTRGTSTDTVQMWIQSDDINHVGSLGNNEMIQLVLRNNTTFNTTTNSGHASALDIVVNGTIASGANPLENIGIAIAGHGTGAGVSNYAIKSTDTVATLQHDGPAQFGGPSGTSVVQLGNTVKRFTVLDASPTSVTSQLDVGVIASVDGYNMHLKNTATGVSAMGMALQGDTTVNASVQPQIVIYRAAGGTGSTFGILEMDNGGAGYIATAAANDLVLANFATSKRLLLSGGAGVIGLALDNAGNVAAPNGALSGSTVLTGGASGSKWSRGSGAPGISCAIGDLFSRTDGSTSTTLYVCTAINTWTAK